jgi:pimeloyl-ACP methyl ester carboxylesterase
MTKAAEAALEVLSTLRLVPVPGRPDVALALHSFSVPGLPYEKKRARPVLLLHGAVENGRIFYTSSGKGLAPFLARQGYTVYVLDFRGHGRSEPRISRKFDCSLGDVVLSDIPLAIETMLEETGQTRFHAMAHSFGGTVLLAALVRHPSLLARCTSVVTFASRRRLRAFSWKKVYMIDVMWNRVAPFLTKTFGYLPAHRFRFGVESEARTWHAESVRWIREARWKDAGDGFDYGGAWRVPRLRKPALLFLTGAADPVLGHPRDVRDLRDECPVPRSEFRVVGKAMGHLHDYDHISLLTHRDAPADHFPWIVNWLAEAERLPSALTGF